MKIIFQILERMEKILLSFQSDLGSISHEILTLQQESVQVVRFYAFSEIEKIEKQKSAYFHNDYELYFMIKPNVIK